MYYSLFLVARCEQIVAWRENKTFPVSLSCLYKPGDDLYKLFNAAGLLISM